MRTLGRRIKISSIQKTDWKTDLYEYLTLYHSTPQEATGISPGQMMFNRELRNTIPSIHSPPNLTLETARDRDMAKKEYHADRANQRRQAKEHDLGRGDTVLMKNLKKGTSEPNFREEEFKVVNVDNGAVFIKSNDSGKVYVRNSTHLKKLDNHQSIPEVNTNSETRTSGEHVADADTESTSEAANTSVKTRQKRNRKRPDRYDDYV